MLSKLAKLKNEKHCRILEWEFVRKVLQFAFSCAVVV
jgi:hypothetical protein